MQHKICKPTAGGPHCRGVRRGLSFLLVLIIAFCSFPFSVFAADIKASTDAVTYNYNGSYKNETPAINSDGYYYVSNNSIGYDVYSVEIDFNRQNRFLLNRDDVVKFSINLYPQSRYKSFEGYFDVSGLNPSGNFVSIRDSSVTYDYNTGQIQFAVQVPYDLKDCFVTFKIYNIKYTGLSGCPPFYFAYKNALISYDSEANVNSGKVLNSINGLGDRIGAWFNNLKESITGAFENLANKINQFITVIGDRVEGFFLDLKKFFDGVTKQIGNWFTELGDKIGGWFTDLGNKIGYFFTNLFNNISSWFDEHLIQPVRNWWQSVIDWFKLMFTLNPDFWGQYIDDFTDYLKEHFGALYQVFEMIELLFNALIEIVTGSYGDLIISIPEIKLPFLNHQVLLEAQEFNFSSYINNIPMLAFVLSIIKVIADVSIIFAIINFLIKKYNTIVGGESD